MKVRLLISPVKERKVCLIGNLNIDLIIRNVPQLPRWGQEVFGDNYLLASSGQSAYTAFALSRFQVPATIIGNVGSDIYGEKIIHDLQTSGVDISEIEKVEGGSTGITVAIVRSDGERAFVSDPSSLASFDRKTVNRHISAAEAASIVLISGNFFLPHFSLEDISYFSRIFQRSGITTMLDTGWDSDCWPEATIRKLRSCLKYIDYFIPNMDEAGAITGEKSPEKASEKLLSDGCRVVIVKMGAEGSYLRTEDDEIFIPSFKSEVFDAVGAGDVFNAGFILGTLHNWPLEARMIFGAATASRYISKAVDRFPNLGEAVILANQNDKFEFKESE